MGSKMNKVKELQADIEQGLLSNLKILMDTEEWSILHRDDLGTLNVVKVTLTEMLKSSAASIAQSVSLDLIAAHNDAIETAAKLSSDAFASGSQHVIARAVLEKILTLKKE